MVLGSGAPKLTVLSAPGVNSTYAWVWSDQRGTRDSPEHSGRGIGARSRLAMVRGGSGSTASRVHTVPAPVWLGFWYSKYLHSVAKPHRVLARGYGAAGWVRPWRGGGGASACGVMEPRVCHGLRQLAQMKQGIGVVLTGGSGRPEMQRSGVQQGRRRWRVAANGRSSWRRHCRGPPGSWIP